MSELTYAQRPLRSSFAQQATWPAVGPAHLLEKALYEIVYELNNRPEWVRIPLRGVLDLIGR